MSMTIGESSSRKVAVANLKGFRQDVRTMLKRLQPGQRRDFSPSLTALERGVVQDSSAEISFCFESHEAGEHSFVSVTRPGGRDQGEPVPTRDTSSTNHLHGKEAVPEAKHNSESEAAVAFRGEGESVASIVSKIFMAYATGKFNGETIFLRFPDLNEFAEDAKDAMPAKHRLFMQFRADLESVFDDTMQLQVDMGTRTTKGLTLQWFQVFIQKAMKKVGAGCVGLLFALISDIR
jgi:hypothetical protein